MAGFPQWQELNGGNRGWREQAMSRFEVLTPPFLKAILPLAKPVVTINQQTTIPYTVQVPQPKSKQKEACANHLGFGDSTLAMNLDK